MIPAPATPATVAVTFVVLAGLFVAISYGCSRGIATAVVRTDWSLGTKEKILVNGRFVLGAVAAVTGYFLYLSYPAAAPLRSVVPSGVAVGAIALELGVSLGLTAMAGVYAVQRGIEPTLDDLLEWNHTVASHHRRRKLFVIGIPVVGVPMAVVLMSLAGMFARSSLRSVVMVLVLFVLLYNVVLYFGQQFLLLHTYGTRDPTPTERRRLERCYEQFGGSPGKLVIYQRSNGDIPLGDAGRNDHRWVWLRESLLEETDDEELGILLAQAAEKNRQGYFTHLSSAGIIITLPAFVIPYLDLDSASFVGGFSVVTLLAVLISVHFHRAKRRTSYKADEFACQHFDPKTVLRTYRRHDSLSYDITTRSKIVNKLRDVRIDRRIEHLESQYDLDAGDLVADEPTTTPSGPEPLLAAMDQASFTRFVAALRSRWDWDCDVRPGGHDDRDEVVATAPSADKRVFILPIHRSAEANPVVEELPDADDLEARLEVVGADAAMVVTNGRFADALRERDDLTLVDGDQLLELIDDADATDLLEEHASPESSPSAISS